MHIAKADTAHSPYHTQGEWEAMMKAVSAPLVEAEPDEVQWHPEFVQDESDAEPKEQAGPSNQTIVDLIAAFSEWMRNFKVNQPIVNVNPKLEMPRTVRETVIERDERTGKMSAARTTERPVE